MLLPNQTAMAQYPSRWWATQYWFLLRCIWVF